MEWNEKSPNLFFGFDCAVNEGPDVQLFLEREPLNQSEDLALLPKLEACVSKSLFKKDCFDLSQTEWRDSKKMTLAFHHNTIP